MTDLTLPEFLLARIAEDEAVARPLYVDAPGYLLREAPRGWVEITPSRIEAECEAKRRIVEEHPRCDVHDRPGNECDACQTCGDGSIWPCPTILHLAAVYADHPDYREEWKP